MSEDIKNRISEDLPIINYINIILEIIRKK
jgi:hypothetical protein